MCPPYNLVTEEQLQLIHDKSMQILEEAGIAFYDEPAQEILRAHGVKVVGGVADAAMMRNGGRDDVCPTSMLARFLRWAFGSLPDF